MITADSGRPGDGRPGTPRPRPTPPPAPAPKPKVADLGAWALWGATAVFVTLGTTWWWPS